MITESLIQWCKENRMAMSYEEHSDYDIVIIEDFARFLYIHPFDGKIIDGDFSFILSDKEFEMCYDKTQGTDIEEDFKFILFEFGGKFYYSGLKTSTNRYNEIIFKPEFNDFKYLGKSTENDEDVPVFIHLGVHSEYEMLNGSGACSLWTKKASFMRMPALGICDKNTLAGALSFQSACDGVGVKPIIGETVTVAVNYEEGQANPETFELKLYCMNKHGWKNLLLINKAINVDYDGFIPDTLLYTLGKGLCVVVPEDSEFNYVKDDRTVAVKLIAKYKKAFDRVYYQIDTVEYTSQQLFKRHLENIDTYICRYKKLMKPLLINDSYYLDQEEADLKGMLNKISGKAAAESNNQYFKSFIDTWNSYAEWDGVDALYECILEAITNTGLLVDKVDFKINTGERKLPKFEVKDCESLYFRELERGISERLADKSEAEMKKYLERLETECKVIVPNGLCDYFMILWDIKNWCRKNNILTGPGRGSVCGSLVAYLLYITDVDPLKYNTLFERFLNETRVKAPEVWEIELEDGEKLQVPIDKKIPLVDGSYIDIDDDLDLSSIDIDIDKLKSEL